MQLQNTGTDVYSSLVTRFTDELRCYGYTKYDDTALETSRFIMRIMTPRNLAVSYHCNIIEMPLEVQDFSSAKRFLNHVRNMSSRRYAKFPWFKEIGTFLVILCSHEQYIKLIVHVARLTDKTGVHINTILGIVLVDREHYQAVGATTWGLFHSGEHYQAIIDTTAQWCNEQRARRVQQTGNN